MDLTTPIVTTVTPSWEAANRPGQRAALLALLFGPVTEVEDDAAGAV